MRRGCTRTIPRSWSGRRRRLGATRPIRISGVAPDGSSAPSPMAIARSPSAARTSSTAASSAPSSTLLRWATLSLHCLGVSMHTAIHRDARTMPKRCPIGTSGLATPPSSSIPPPCSACQYVARAALYAPIRWQCLPSVPAPPSVGSACPAFLRPRPLAVLAQRSCAPVRWQCLPKSEDVDCEHPQQAGWLCPGQWERCAGANENCWESRCCYNDGASHAWSHVGSHAWSHVGSH